MDESTLVAAEDRIFDKYRNLHPDRAILPDGAADPATYLVPTNFRILFVLKEGNDLEGAWTTQKGGDLRKFASAGGRFATWANIATWIALANRLPVTTEDRRNEEWRAEQLRKSAFVNLKKIPGGSTATTSEIMNFALEAEHRILLRSQLELYEPEVTLACGVGIYAVLEKLFDGRPERPKDHDPAVHDVFRFFKDERLGPVIDFYHPGTHQTGGWLKLAEMLQSNLRYHFPDRYS